MSARGTEQKCSYRGWEELTPVTGKESCWQKRSPLATNKLWQFSAGEEYLRLGYLGSNSDGQEIQGKKRCWGKNLLRKTASE